MTSCSLSKNYEYRWRSVYESDLQVCRIGFPLKVFSSLFYVPKISQRYWLAGKVVYCMESLIVT